MKEYKNYYSRLKSLLALEMSCSPRVFEEEKNILTVSELHDGMRRYSAEAVYFSMVTLGGCAVITANSLLHPFLERFIKDKAGHTLFELESLRFIDNELGKHGYKLCNTQHKFLPCLDAFTSRDYPIKWYGQSEIMKMYGDSRFPNAIAEKFVPQRPDVLAVQAFFEDELMGMAGSSVDAPEWQQIGIDVIPKYRSMGVGTYLVTLLRNEIEKTGDIPFYGTDAANYYSWNIALNSGFRPTWVEISATKQKFA